MAEFASKGLVNGLSIPALILGSLGFLGSSGNGNGPLGGFFGGGNCNQQAALMAENASLRAQKYSDEQDAKLYQATRSENEKLANQMMAFITPLSQEAASNRERVAVLESPDEEQR